MGEEAMPRTEAQENILKEVRMSLVRNSPEDWHEIILSASMLYSRSAFDTRVAYADRKQERMNTPIDVKMNLMDLRERMYHESRGAWFSVVFGVGRSGYFTVDFNYCNEPSFRGTAPMDDEYASDLERFPRSPEATPEWLRRKIEAAAPEG
ncbi:hypothetical protein [Streptomonospora salina]|uniref:Uncharacterized protein n=1 Tax=Streptomonospora salina TaxID=104205 RepID=A0A841EBD4_9ACTN|nr:hypothetical protein [Streptomonospora salina]MBB5998338.1 hypothetical protein [Streptomonospora salina]